MGLDQRPFQEVVGQQHRIQFGDDKIDIIPLPHPSGVSTWHVTEPGKTLLHDALDALHDHPQWKQITESELT